MKVNFSNKTPYCIVGVIFLFFNLIIYNYFVSTQNNREKLMLEGYLDSVGNLILHDLRRAIGINASNDGFLVLQNFSVANNEVLNSKEKIVQEKEEIQIKPYAIYIENSAKKLILDLQEFREILSKIFPQFVSYAVFIKDYNIALSQDNNPDFNIIKNYKINDNTSLVLKIGIKKGSDFYISNKNILYTNVVITGTLSFFICLLCLYLYLKVKTRIEEKFDILEHELFEERKVKFALLSNKKIDLELNKLFIKKATEMYVKQESGATIEETKKMNLSLSQYLFPMSLYDPSPDKISITDLKKKLEEYFAPYFVTTALKVQTTVNAIFINCTSEVLYQIMFSLIYNLMEFMDKQSELPRAMKVSFSDKKIIINYDSFPLDEERMINLSDSIIKESMDIFLLNCSKIFKSLKEHKFEYKITSKNEQNIVEIIYPLSKSNKQSQENNVIDFLRYQR